MAVSTYRSRRLSTTLIFIASAAITFEASGASPADRWSPRQPVEVVVSFAPGGAGDRLARTLQKIFQEHRLVTTVLVANKPGGAGNVAWSYLESREGGGNHIALITPTIMTNYITGRSKYNYSDFTPIASLFSEHVVFTVQANSPVKDWNDLTARLRKDPSSITLASTSREGAAPLIFSLALKEAGIDPKAIKLVVFGSASQALAAVLGGHADVNLSTPESVKAHLSGNTVRVLAISSQQRISQGQLAEVPTLSELGINVSFKSWRAVLGPCNMTAPQVSYWDGVFSRMTAAEEWGKALAFQDATNEYRNSSDTRIYLKAQYDQLRLILTELGLSSK